MNHGIAGSVGPTVDARGSLFGLENSASKLSQSGILDTKGRPCRDIGRSLRVNKQLTLREKKEPKSSPIKLVADVAPVVAAYYHIRKEGSSSFFQRVFKVVIKVY